MYQLNFIHSIRTAPHANAANHSARAHCTYIYIYIVYVMRSGSITTSLLLFAYEPIFFFFFNENGKKKCTSFIETFENAVNYRSVQHIEWSSKTMLMSHLFNLHAMYSILNGSVLFVTLYRIYECFVCKIICLLFVVFLLCIIYSLSDASFYNKELH